MKIIVVHNIAPGGSRRALHGQLAGLGTRGHYLSLFAPRATERHESLAQLCDEATLWGPDTEPSPTSVAGGDEGQARRLAQKVLGRSLYEQVRDRFWTSKQRKAAQSMEEGYERIVPQILAQSPDLVFVHQCQNLLVPRSLLQQLAGRVPLVFYMQDTLRRAQEWPAQTDSKYDLERLGILQQRDLGRLVTPAMLRWRNEERHRYESGLRALRHRPGARVLVNSYFSRESTLRTSGVEGHVCYLGVDHNFFTPPPAAHPRRREVLSVGALRPEKRHDRIIAAIGTIPAALRPTLRIIGYRMPSGPDPYADYLVDLAEQQQVSLTLQVEVSDESLRDAYCSAALMVFAPYLEPFGLVVLEAMACGLPVVTIGEGGPREIVCDGETGFVTDGDPRDIGAAIATLLGNPERAATMGKRGREHVTTRWTWEQSLQTLEKNLTLARQEWEVIV